jgi:hypothetical protein
LREAGASTRVCAWPECRRVDVRFVSNWEVPARDRKV